MQIYSVIEIAKQFKMTSMKFKHKGSTVFVKRGYLFTLFVNKVRTFSCIVCTFLLANNAINKQDITTLILLHKRA